MPFRSSIANFQRDIASDPAVLMSLLSARPSSLPNDVSSGLTLLKPPLDRFNSFPF